MNPRPPWSQNVVTPPAIEPVTLAEFCVHERITEPGPEGDLIEGYIAAARETVEEYLQRVLITTTKKIVLDDWPEGEILDLHDDPIQSVSSIVYKLEDGTTETLDATEYDVDTGLGRVLLATDASWPTDSLREGACITVTYVAGYGATAASVPRRYRLAIHLLAAHWFTNREPVITGTIAAELPLGIMRLLGPSRRRTV